MKLRLFIIISSFLTLTGLTAQNHWIQLNFPDTLHINCITTNDYGDIFVGVGYNNEQGGVYRSLDEGITWELVYDDGTHSILSINIDENGQIFAGSSNGLQPLVMSTDNGNSWGRIEPPFGYVGNVTNIEIYDDELYISMWGSSTSLFRSSDFGITWDTLYELNSASENITSLKFDSYDNIIFSVMGFQENTGGVYSSSDNGVTWELLGLHNHQVIGMDINTESEIFTCDWGALIGYNPGINALYSDSSNFSLILSGINFTDLKINSDGDIFCSGTFGIIFSEDNGYNFEYFDTISNPPIDHIHVSSNDYVYIGRNSYLAISALTTTTEQSHSFQKENVIFDIFPNPATNYIFFQCKQDKTNIFKIRIYDINGKCLLIHNYIKDEELLIDLNHFKSGTYIIEVASSNEIYRKKFIKLNP